MKLTKQEGAAFNDRIDLELSPSQLEALVYLTEERSLSDKDYTSVGIWREIKDYLQKRHWDWRNARDKKEKDE